MRVEGNCGVGGATNMRGLPVPIEPVPSGRDPFSDLERAHTPHWRIPTVPTPATATRPAKPRAARQEPPMDRPALTHPLEDLPDYIVEFAKLMATTENHADPDIRLARKAVANSAVHLQRIHRDWLADVDGRPTLAVIPTQPKAKPKKAKPQGRGKGWRQSPAHVVDDVVRLYTDEQLPISEIAERWGLSQSTVRNQLNSRGVQRRNDRQALAGTGAKKSARRLADLGVTSATVRGWALDNGHPVSLRGAIPAPIVDAFIAAHEQVAS